MGIVSKGLASGSILEVQYVALPDLMLGCGGCGLAINPMGPPRFRAAPLLKLCAPPLGKIIQLAVAMAPNDFFQRSFAFKPGWRGVFGWLLLGLFLNVSAAFLFWLDCWWRSGQGLAKIGVQHFHAFTVDRKGFWLDTPQPQLQVWARESFWRCFL